MYARLLPQSAVLIVWNAVCYMHVGLDDVLVEIKEHNSTPYTVFKWYSLLALVDGLHSVSKHAPARPPPRLPLLCIIPTWLCTC